MKKNVKALILLLSAAMLLGSCSGGGDAPSGETASQSAGTTEVVTTAPLNYLTLTGDWKGKTFRVLGMHHNSYEQFCNFEIWAEGENGDIVNDAVFRRNTEIETKYNVVIEQKLAETTQVGFNTPIFQTIQKSVLSADDSFDTFFIQLREAGNVIMNKMALDLYGVPNIDFSQPYWNEHTNESMSISGKLYLTNSDFSLLDKKRTYILMYNRDMYKDFGKSKLEDMVYDGTWTFDELVKLCKAVSADLNGDGLIDNNDRWGIGMDSVHAINALAIGMNGTLVAKDKNDTPVINVGSERMVSIAGKIFDSFNNSTNGYYCSQYPNWKLSYSASSTSGVLFKNGQQLFVTSFPQSLSNFSASTDIDYGVITYPKYNETQEKYYTFADRFGSVLFGIPLTVTDSAFTGFMLEALSGYSTETTLNAYYEVSCKVKHVYDETSADMLDLTFRGITFDLGTIFNWGNINTETIQKLMKAESNTYVSDWEGIKGKAEAALKETLDTIAKQ